MKEIGILCSVLILINYSNCAQKVRYKRPIARQGLGSNEDELYNFLSRITPSSEDLQNQASDI